MRQPHFLRLVFIVVFLSGTFAAHAQGCSMCRDTTAGSASQIRAGLRRAIPVLAIPAIALFVGFFLVARRTDAWHRTEPDTWQGSDEPQTIDKDS